MCDGNVADVTLAAGVGRPRDRLRRHFLTTSACGVCGKDSIDAIRVRARYDVSADPLRISPGRAGRAAGPAARGAAGVRAAPAGCTPPGCSPPTATLLVLREDVGRHNAVDKVIGWALRTGGCRWPAACCWSAAGPRSSSPRRR